MGDEEGKPVLIDLFCRAGGCTKGYQRAGFYVIGVDASPQPRYCGDEFFQADALTFDLSRADAVHASPPCQAFTVYRNVRPDLPDRYPDLLPVIRKRLDATGLPYVIENVAGAPLKGPVQLCGTGFGLDVRRHRLFESNVWLWGMACSHGRHAARFPGSTNRRHLSRTTVEVGVWRVPLETQLRAMGIDWMTREELSEAIPPAYTEYLGHQLIAHVRVPAV